MYYNKELKRFEYSYQTHNLFIADVYIPDLVKSLRNMHIYSGILISYFKT